MNTHNRKNNRLQGYDYSSVGVYFVTICTYNRESLFGEIINKKDNELYLVGAGLCSALNYKTIKLSEIGEIIEYQWSSLPNRYSMIELFEFIVMPNHLHGIIYIKAEQSPAPTLADIVCAFKSITTKESNKLENIKGRKIWQRNYYEHIIRDDKSLTNITDYIISNPLNWEADKYYIS